MKTIKIIMLLTIASFFVSVPIVVESKDCSNVVKLHKKLLCKAGSDKYGDETSNTKKQKGESFNEKYNSVADIFKKIKGN